ncbi:hypothetical protein C2G38_2061778 [Gigaspora rosea]|uniref:Uncharacterized protein n=1 Tax=Gigaspora rosea TaxID=44941 RepID=A0A397VY12_9GLOM|nr:hypothetical protein C2G38_2061778 [Gigaspora rosea]
MIKQKVGYQIIYVYVCNLIKYLPSFCLIVQALFTINFDNYTYVPSVNDINLIENIIFWNSNEQMRRIMCKNFYT